MIKLGKDFEIIINENTERGKDIIKVFGTNIVKIKSPIPEYISTPDHREVLAYFIDLSLITKKRRENMIKHLSEKFNQSIESVKENLEKFGVPILKKECSLIIENPQRWI